MKIIGRLINNENNHEYSHTCDETFSLNMIYWNDQTADDESSG